jgi:hypothetical protein
MHRKIPCSLFLFIGKTMHRKILCSLFLFIGKTMHRKILCSLFLFIGKTTDDMICQAIVASHEPKQSTAIRIKQYLMDYHPDFNVESRPHRFKMAIERALKKGTIK